MTKVKICGITNLEDALLSAKFGADALGFNFYAKSPRYISPAKAREIIERLPAEILKVGVFVNESVENILEIAVSAKLDAIQLHGDETQEFVRHLRSKTPIEIIKAFRVSENFWPDEVLNYETDAVLLDAYSAEEFGGTGETFDWEVAKRVREIQPRTYLAGGLTHDNIRSAISSVNPFAVDVCSGIESRKGKKDKILLINFITKAKRRLSVQPTNRFYDLLSAIHRQPQMYFSKKSLTRLHDFLYGFGIALNLGEAQFETGKFYTDDFNIYSEKFFNEEIPGGQNGVVRFILRKYNEDEEKSFDAFFALLEEFKLEVEKLYDE